jgi:HSP20 family protein
MGTWNPFRELDSLRREVERAFEQFSGPAPSTRFRSAFLPGRAARSYPLINLHEDGDHIRVEALMPGVNPEKVEVTAVNNTLRISGEKQPLSEEIQPDAFHRSERSAGAFTRTISLPIEIDSERVTADYVNGILKVTLPKSEAAKPRKISVNVA